jgi:hypothetical protein
VSLQPCRECGKTVSTAARTCPHCGVSPPDPMGEAVRVHGVGYVKGLAAIVALIVIVAFIADRFSTSPGAASADPRTLRRSLDLTRPIFVIAGSPACPAEDEVEAARCGAPNYCARSPGDLPAVEMETRGFLAPVYRVRLVGVTGVVEAWASYEGLRN